ncbi:hypothetical protein SRHO_G00179410 [Serrasalmus rhombeus]
MKNTIGFLMWVTVVLLTTDTNRSGADSTATLNDPCTNYTALDQPWRATNATGLWICDRYFNWTGWYRLLYNGMSVRMPDSCVNRSTCGTDITLWLNGSHPQTEDGIVARGVCGRSGSDCCYYRSTPIRVKACPGNYYVYEFVRPNSCVAAYCADVNTITLNTVPTNVTSVAASNINTTDTANNMTLDPCSVYSVLDNDWRKTDSGLYRGSFDDTLIEWSGWYRLYLQGKSAQIPESDWCWSFMTCGGYTALLLGGSHPQPQDDIVTREIFGTYVSSVNSRQCNSYRSNPIQVKACPGNYYVYRLVKPAALLPIPTYCAETSRTFNHEDSEETSTPSPVGLPDISTYMQVSQSATATTDHTTDISSAPSSPTSSQASSSTTEAERFMPTQFTSTDMTLNTRTSSETPSGISVTEGKVTSPRTETPTVSPTITSAHSNVTTVLPESPIAAASTDTTAAPTPIITSTFASWSSSPATTAMVVPAREGEGGIILIVRMQQVFIPAYNDPSSTEYNTLVSNITAELNRGFREMFPLTFLRCYVLRLWNGSVGVDTHLVFINETVLPNATVLTDSLKSAINDSTICLDIIPSSISTVSTTGHLISSTGQPSQSATATPDHTTDTSSAPGSPVASSTKAQGQDTSPRTGTTTVSPTTPGAYSTVAAALPESPIGTASTATAAAPIPIITSTSASWSSSPATTTMPVPVREGEGVIILIVRIQQDFIPAYNDNSSTEYNTLVNNITAELNRGFTEQFPLTFLRCCVIKLWNGSVGVHTQIIFKNETVLPNETVLTDSLKSARNASKVFLNIIPSSITAAVGTTTPVSTTRPASSTKLTTTPDVTSLTSASSAGASNTNSNYFIILYVAVAIAFCGIAAFLFFWRRRRKTKMNRIMEGPLYDNVPRAQMYETQPE